MSLACKFCKGVGRFEELDNFLYRRYIIVCKVCGYKTRYCKSFDEAFNNWSDEQ